MPSLQLKAEPLLGGFHATIDTTDLIELADLAILSIAVPQGGEAALTSALAEACGAERPSPGKSSLSSDGRTRFLWTAQDQLFALLDDDNPNATADLSGKLEGKAYITLQSDNWVALRLSGGKAREALARICPIDLHPSVFPEGHVARTMMEHMGAIVLHDGPDSFLLLSASSTARSYLHAVETSLRNVS